MSAFIDMARAYPGRTLITLLALLVAALVEGVSLSAMFPALTLAINQTMSTGEVEHSRMYEFFESLGLPTTLGPILVFIVVGMLIKNMLVLLTNRYVGITGVMIVTNLRLTLLRGLLASRWTYYVSQPIGALANSISSEPTRASAAYLSGNRFVARLVEVTVYVTVAFVVSWQATLAAIAVGALLMFLLRRLVMLSKRAGRRRTMLLKSLLVRLTDTLQSVKPLKAMGRTDLAGEVLEYETGRLNKALRKEVFATEALSAFYEPLTTIFIAVAVYVTVTHAALPFATVMVLVVLLMRVLGFLGKLQRQYQKLVSTESAYWSIRNTISEIEAAREPSQVGVEPCLEKALVLKGVRFDYGENQVLRGVSLNLPAGSFSTVTGASGGGKTTLIDIVTGLLEPQEGSVEVDGIPMSEVNLAAWRRLIGYVPQETLLLHDSVYHNITLGAPDLTEADAERALKKAGAWEFVSALPEGLHSEVGERGGRLSGGQRQRINIARALVHRPRLLILDEATSALDPESEAAICQSLSELRSDITILAISHQAGLRDIADTVYRLEDGEITVAKAASEESVAALDAA